LSRIVMAVERGAGGSGYRRIVVPWTVLLADRRRIDTRPPVPADRGAGGSWCGRIVIAVEHDVGGGGVLFK
jgi:hypothetical protein